MIFILIVGKQWDGEEVPARYRDDCNRRLQTRFRVNELTEFGPTLSRLRRDGSFSCWPMLRPVCRRISHPGKGEDAMTTRGRMAQIGQLGWLIRSLAIETGVWVSGRGVGLGCAFPSRLSARLLRTRLRSRLMACIVHRGIGHGEHDAGRATPVDRGRNAALRRARARGTRRGRRRRAERTDQQLILHARSAWMQDEGI